MAAASGYLILYGKNDIGEPGGFCFTWTHLTTGQRFRQASAGAWHAKASLSSVLCARVSSCPISQAFRLSARRPTNQTFKRLDSKYAWGWVLHPGRQQPHRATILCHSWKRRESLSTRSSPYQLLRTGCHGVPNPPSVSLVPGSYRFCSL
jgi:hypothetical protein